MLKGGMKMKKLLIFFSALLLVSAVFAFAPNSVAGQEIPHACSKTKAFESLGLPVSSNPVTDDVCGTVVNCKANKPTGTCSATTGSPTKTVCKTTTGGSCIYRCKLSGFYDDGAACTSGFCNAAGNACA